MVSSIAAGPVHLEILRRFGNHPLNDVVVRLSIEATDQAGDQKRITIEGPLGPELMHFLHALIVLFHGEEDEWVIPTLHQPIQVMRHGHRISLAPYPAENLSTSLWSHTAHDAVYHVELNQLIFGLSTLVEEVLHQLSHDFATDESVRLLVQQWERLWQWASRWFTFGALRFSSP